MFLSHFSLADEGMWLPIHIERLYNRDLKKMGLQLSPEEIYSVNKACLKDAVVSLGGFCTGEIVSNEGLMLTNHHCAYDAIQKHSSVANNYLKDGFWAKRKSDELPNEGLYARILVRMEDVTKDIFSATSRKMSDKEKEDTIHKTIEELKKQAIEGTHYDAVIKPFFEGNEFYLFVYETYRDVRLVGAPPSSIGLFGGDTDNWQWPRHTGDFSLFRVYSDRDGKPSKYNEANIPLKPKYSLPISLKGTKPNDFAMIMGYPGRTDRYLTSPGIKLAVEHTNQYLIDIFKKRQQILKKEMDKDEATKIKYASKYARLGNYYKYLIGQNKGLKKLEVYEKKLEIENRFKRWINKRKSRRNTYGKVLRNIHQTYKEFEKDEKNYTYSYNTFRLIEALNFSKSYLGLEEQLNKNGKLDEKTIKLFKEKARAFFSDYEHDIDKEVFEEMLTLYTKNVDKSSQVDIYSILEKNETDFSKHNVKTLTDFVYSKSMFCLEKKIMTFIDNPELQLLEKDPLLQLNELLSFQNETLSNKMEDNYDDLSESNRLYIEGLRKMYPSTLFYPNANFTLRFTYGTVGGYNPADAVNYHYFTTLKGVIEKEDKDNPEFFVPKKLKKLYEEKDYGQYANKDGDMEVAFLTNNDITGGNSGSPVINGEGQLVGIAFDGNWEAMSGDIAFEPALQRTISVDIRYVLFIIDKFAGAGHLVKEMNLVK